MSSKKLLAELWNKGVRGCVISWSCGGDDGSIDGIEYLPSDRHPNPQLTNELEELGWEVYQDLYDGATAGEFNNYGSVEIVIDKGGKYYCRVENDYSEDEWDEESDESIIVNEEHTETENYILN